MTPSQIMQAARTRAGALEKEIQTMKERRRQIQAELEALINAVRNGTPLPESVPMVGPRGGSKRTRFRILKRDGFKCVYCGRGATDVELEVDHVTPVSKGGTSHDSNLVTACRECNGGKSDHLLTEAA